MSKSEDYKTSISKTQKVYKNKDLNNANFGDFTLNDYQVFLYLISKMGGVDRTGKYLQPEQLQREHTLTAKEFSKMFATDISHCYKLLFKSCKRLMKTSIIIQKAEIKETWEINICSRAQYNKDNGSISIKFTDDIMPYLAQVKQKFVLYNLKEVSNFGSLYTTRLYELIQAFKETGWVLQSVEQLREVLAARNSFKLYADFKKYTFSHACKEINDNYDINLRFEEIKEGRKVVAVKFFFKPTKIIRRLDQAGNVHNTYLPPEAKKKIVSKALKEVKASFTVLEDQAPIRTEYTNHLSSIVDSVLAQIKPIKN